MGYYKRLTENAQDARRYKSIQKRTSRMQANEIPHLIRMETLSEIERYNMAQNIDLLQEYHKELERWQDNTVAKLRASVSLRSKTIGPNLFATAYTDKLGVINRLGFSFPRHGVYLHKGAKRGHAGYKGSKWNLMKTINGVKIDTKKVRTTNPSSMNNLADGFHWFDPIIQSQLSSLADISVKYWDTQIIDATRIFIDK